MSREKVKETFEKLYERNKCYNMSIFINAIMLSARGKDQYFKVTRGEDCLVLFLTCNGYPIVTVLEKYIDYISVHEGEE